MTSRTSATDRSDPAVVGRRFCKPDSLKRLKIESSGKAAETQFRHGSGAAKTRFRVVWMQFVRGLDVV